MQPISETPKIPETDSSPPAALSTVTTAPPLRKRWNHRVVPPAETLRRMTPHFETMGITRLADVTGLDILGIPVFQAVRPMGLSLSVAQGKGIDMDAAAASAAMEAAEGWHAEYPLLTTWRGSLADVEAAAPADHLPLRGPIPGNTPLTLVECRDLISGENAPLPFDLIHKDYTRRTEHPNLCLSTNGLASGNTLAEAVASALHEVIERDAAAEFAAHPCPDSCHFSTSHAATLSADAAQLVGQVREAGLKLWLYDITSDLRVPAVRAKIGHVRGLQEARPMPLPSIGHGCHVDPATALTRAITEAAQSRLTLIAGSRDDLDDGRYDPAPGGNVGWFLSEAAVRLEHPPAPFDHPDASGTCAEADVARLCTRLADAGINRIFIVDLSRPGFPVHVVRVIVPGLGFLDRHHPKRGARHAEPQW